MHTTIVKKNKVTFLFAVNTPEQLEKIKHTTCSIFGGYNLVQSFGGWTDEGHNKGQILEEISYKLEILTDKDYKHLENLSEHICKIAVQSEVYFYIDSVKLNITQNY
mgnify:CR=1 FL=1|tara:strand:- start:796 stop:1116 length:321 start_codon:yes stop_codon:yes gene_type:complete